MVFKKSKQMKKYTFKRKLMPLQKQTVLTACRQRLNSMIRSLCKSEKAPLISMVNPLNHPIPHQITMTTANPITKTKHTN